jgi:hypothetical protein
VSLIVFLEFWRILCLAGTNQKIGKETILEGSGTQRDLAPKEEASGRGTDPPGRRRPRGGPPQTGRPHGGAGRPPPRAPRQPYFWNVLPPPMRININRMLGWFDRTTHGILSRLYRQPPGPLVEEEYGSQLFIHQIKSTS